MLIAQITDTHIVEKGKHWLSQPATQTAERLAKTVKALNHLNPRPDVVLLTGDAADTGTREAYIHLKELLRPLQIPLFVVPGNHDNREEMRHAFSDQTYMPKQGLLHYAIENYPVRFIGLDTNIKGENRGEITEKTLHWLEEKLREDPAKSTLIFLHHPPVSIGYALFDKLRGFVPIRFVSILQNSPQILGILTGHCHFFCLSSLGGKPCFIAPSVAPAMLFAHPQDLTPSALELADPAIALHEWKDGHPLTSRLHWIKKHEQIDWAEILRLHGPR